MTARSSHAGGWVFGGVARPPSRTPQNVHGECEALGSKGQCWSRAVKTCHVLVLDVLTLHREQ